MYREFWFNKQTAYINDCIFRNINHQYKFIQIIYFVALGRLYRNKSFWWSLGSKVNCLQFLFNSDAIVYIIKVEMFSSSFLKNTVALAYSQTYSRLLLAYLKFFYLFQLLFKQITSHSDNYCKWFLSKTLQERYSFTLRISSVNVIKSSDSG